MLLGNFPATSPSLLLCRESLKGINQLSWLSYTESLTISVTPLIAPFASIAHVADACPSGKALSSVDVALLPPCLGFSDNSEPTCWFRLAGLVFFGFSYLSFPRYFSPLLSPFRCSFGHWSVKGSLLSPLRQGYLYNKMCSSF